MENILAEYRREDRRLRGRRVRRREADRRAAHASSTSTCRSICTGPGTTAARSRSCAPSTSAARTASGTPRPTSTGRSRSRATSGSCRAIGACCCRRSSPRWAPTRRPAARPRGTSSPHLISQLLHGEQAALQLCGQLTNACPTMDAKFYAGSQVIDEVRHVEVLSKFLQRKMGVLHPIDPTLKVLLDKLLDGADLEDEDARHADACSRAWRSASST